jgi:hypothetical protein
MISLLESFISALAFLKQAVPSPDRDSPEAAQGIRNELNRTGGSLIRSGWVFPRAGSAQIPIFGVCPSAAARSWSETRVFRVRARRAENAMN